MKDMIRMFGAWFTRRYRVVPWRTLLLFLVLLVYLFSPLDIIPDFIPGVGMIDDLVLFGFLFRSLIRDGRKFREWEKGSGAASPP